MRSIEMMNTSLVAAPGYSYHENATPEWLKGPCPRTDNFTSPSWNWFLCISVINTPLASFLDRYVTPMWLVIGFVGNIITMKIWSHRRMKHINTSALYLTALAATDLLLLFLYIQRYLHFTWGLPTIDVPVWCPTFFVFYMFAQYMSPLLVFGFTTERFVSIVRPFKSERFSRHHRAPKEIIAIALFAFGLSLPQAHGWVYKDSACGGSQTKFFEYWTWITDVLLFCVVPIATFFLNMFVLKVASKATKVRRESTCRQENDSLRSRRSKIAPSTVTLLCISFYRIFTTLPVAILFALQFSVPEGSYHVPVYEMSLDPQWRDYFSWYTAKTIIDTIGLSQYSCNIFIYLMTARHFRHEFINTFRITACCGPAEKPGSFHRHTFLTNGAGYGGASTRITETDM
ncbi:probable G-protein coupled receptor 139 [Ylistrum balloti]|uniref:probable G-protein coupled receptor 139 n=1 Tax=Ylistrum balloti TaxID=509963 RepID=UPI002905EA02|nr:probable G-protein coupled receptor 139 [Ylistrum balloti]XP_060079044.1 probable G-protein coupled receptor 139 [Ylistrum balloti]